MFDAPRSLTVGFVIPEIEKGQDLTQFGNPKYIVDIGAHVGVWGMCMGKLYPACNILCVEPDENNFKRLQEGIFYNNLKNVRALNCAASSQAGTMIMRQDSTNTGSNSLSLGSGKESQCVALTLNNLIDQEVDLVKMDIEGMEFGVFNGFTRWNLIKELTVEVHPALLGGGKQLVDEYCQFLASNMEGKKVYIGSSEPGMHRGYL